MTQLLSVEVVAEKYEFLFSLQHFHTVRNQRRGTRTSLGLAKQVRRIQWFPLAYLSSLLLQNSGPTLTLGKFPFSMGGRG
jgi:hypothetical protein